MGNDDYDGRCADPETVPECANYYGDEAEQKKVEVASRPRHRFEAQQPEVAEEVAEEEAAPIQVDLRSFQPARPRPAAFAPVRPQRRFRPRPAAVPTTTTTTTTTPAPAARKPDRVASSDDYYYYYYYDEE